MIGISLYRVFRAALLNFWRNIWLSLATTVIMIITLLMMLFLYFANVFGAEVLRTIEQKVDISVTFKDNVQDDYIQAIRQEMEARPDVESVTVLSSEQALELFRQRHGDNALIEESLGELEANPLPASMFIVATDPTHYETIARQLEAEKYAPFIDSVNFENTQSVIERLIALVTSVKNIALIVTALFASLVVLIMFNTVRMAIYSFREEIDIMRLVGASRWYIQGPFVIEAVLVALIAVGVVTLMVYPLLEAAGPELQRFFFTTASAEPFDVYRFARERWLTIIGLQLVTAVGLAAISSMVAVRRYLRD